MSRASSWILAGLTLLWSFAAAATADATASLHVVAVAPANPGRPAGDQRWLIYLDGRIDSGATARVVNLILRERISSATVYLNSPGGSLVTAMQLGRVLREHAFDARVGLRTQDVARAAPGTCYSACPFILAGGVQRSIENGSTIGLHRAANRIPVSDENTFQQVVESQVVEYLTEMGVHTELAEFMAATAHDRIRDLTLDEARRLNLLNAGR